MVVFHCNLLFSLESLKSFDDIAKYNLKISFGQVKYVVFSLIVLLMLPTIAVIITARKVYSYEPKTRLTYISFYTLAWTYHTIVSVKNLHRPQQLKYTSNGMPGKFCTNSTPPGKWSKTSLLGARLKFKAYNRETLAHTIWNNSGIYPLIAERVVSRFVWNSIFYI